MAPLHAHLALAPSVSRAVSERADALLTWQTLAAEATAKAAKAERIAAEPLKAGGPFGLGATTAASKSAALEALQRQREAVAAAAQAAEAAYEQIRGRNAAEFARLDATRTAELTVRAPAEPAACFFCVFFALICTHLRANMTLRNALSSAQAMALGFAGVQVAAAERAASIWAPLAEGLSTRGVGGGPSGAALATAGEGATATAVTEAATADEDAPADVASGSGA
jgi:hypothetical protein